jgi:hypothetical protein
VSNTNTNETIADIIREMRDRAITKIGGRTITERNFVPQETVDDWADRIDAALARDTVRLSDGSSAVVECAEERAHLAKIDAEYSGFRNAAAMREALELFVNHASCLYHCDIHRFYPETTSCDGVLADEGECPMKTECDAVFKGRAALSAPARNCDRHGDELDAQLAFLNEVWLISVDRDSMLEKDRFENWTDEMRSAYARWLMAKAEGDDHANA